MVNKIYDVIIVGGGVSGLLSALTLSKNGKKVVLIERSDFVGGNLRTYSIDGWTVDTGVHAITHVDNGPLTTLMADYFDVVPLFIPYGDYHVRTEQGLSVFPWTMQGWLNFDVLPKKDRLAIAQTLGSSVASKVFGSIDTNQSFYDFMKKNDFSEKTWKFIDTISYFMSGKSMYETPLWRIMKGARYNEENEAEELKDKLKGHIASFIKLLSYDGSYHQAYPKGGIGSLTDCIINSFPHGMVKINVGETVKSIETSADGVKCITDKDVYEADYMVYSGFVKDLPSLCSGLDDDFISNADYLKQTHSITIWLGLDMKLDAFNYNGTEIWFGFDGTGHFWAMPTSNYNPLFAPKGKQIVGFTAICGEDPKKEEKRLMGAIKAAIPGIEKHIEFKHVQVTIPEKAAITVGSIFPGPKTPLDHLYIVGTDTDARSMGVTRASFSILKLLEELKKQNKI